VAFSHEKPSTIRSPCPHSMRPSARGEELATQVHLQADQRLYDMVLHEGMSICNLLSPTMHPEVAPASVGLH
jgi:hypothetical protein